MSPDTCRSNDRVAPLTRAQASIWAGHRLLPDTPVYNTAWRFTISGPLDPTLFNQAFEDVAAWCDALRLVIRESAAGPQQTLLDKPAGLLELHQAADEQAADAWIAERVRQPFDLAHASFDSCLLRLPRDRWIWYHNQHHILHDATSGMLLLDAMSAAYAARRDGQVWDRQAVSFLGHATTQASAGRSEAVPAPSRIPVSKLYGRDTTGQGASARMCTIPLGSDRANAFEALAEDDDFAALSPQQTKANLYLTVLAAWMRRVSGQSQLNVGLILHGRDSVATRQMPGCFVELRPVRLDMAEGETFRGLHDRVAEGCVAALRAAAAGDPLPHGPVNAVLNTIPAHFGRFAGHEVEVEWVDCGHTDPGHALRVNVMEFGGAQTAALGFLFNQSVFDSDLMQRAQSHFLALLDAFAADPDAEIDAVALADAKDASTALTTARAEAAAQVPDILEAFRTHAAAAPDAPAITDSGGDSITSRRALLARSAAVADALTSAGVAPGDRVGLHLDRTCDLVAAILGIMSTGATFVPLDPMQPAGRLRMIAQAARLSAVVTEPGHGPDWGACGAVIDISDVKAAGSDTSRSSTAPDNLAYVLYTSGSTGTPKGVAVSRAALSRYAHWAAESHAGGPASWALHTAIGFDLTLTSIFAPLVSGGTIRTYPVRPRSVDLPNADHPGVDLPNVDLSVLNVFRDDAVEIVKLTPAHLAVALTEARRVTTIRTLVLGGEDLTTALATRARAVLGQHLRIVNEYGPTEAVVGCMSHAFDPERDTGASVPIGRPADATQIYVLDAGGHPAADETIGEIHIAGTDRLADGYLGLPEETAARFVSNPFQPGGRMYRSGDLGSVGRDGIVSYHGRADAQLKVGGVRVEPGEIAAAVLAHPLVTAATVGDVRHFAPPELYCSRCGIADTHPEAGLDATGVCAECRRFDALRDRAAAYFRDMSDLHAIVAQAAARRRGDYDCLVLLSGGKDSTYALGRVAEITPRVLAATLDNGFLSAEAKSNIRRVTETLGIEHRFLSTPAMNEIFVDSLRRHANVCNGCFKTIYTLGYRLAQDETIPLIVTGLSRGQLFETRLATELFQQDSGVATDDIDQIVLQARKSYHRFPDMAAQRLNGMLFDDDTVFDTIEIVDFYRYCDVPVAEIYAYLGKKLPWIRPRDTGRSTNCLINDVGIRVHQAKRGFHNYALPYAWDVRLGHKTINEARRELEDEIDDARVADILATIGYPEHIDMAQPETKPVCHYVSSGGLSAKALRAHLSDHLPREMIPAYLVEVEQIPLTSNGKVDRAALPDPRLRIAPDEGWTAEVAPRTPQEAALLKIWQQILRTRHLGVDTNFYEAGGDSIAAIQIAFLAGEMGMQIGATDILRSQTVSALATLGAARSAEASPRPAERPRAELDEQAKARLATLFGRSSDG